MLIELLSILFFSVLLFIIHFNRDPKREPPADAKIICPADGVVINIVKDKEWQKIIIFMHLWDVHVQYVPISGKVIHIGHAKGSYLPADKAKAGENNQIITTLDTQIGKIIIKQISGILARRIKTFITEGQEVKIGEKLGRILFGSRVELWLPAKVKTEIQKNQKVKAGITKIA